MQGLPRQLATMDACRRDIGTRAAQILVERLDGGGTEERAFEMTPTISFGDTLKRY